jgi:quinol-cytochrome oxidoreductase complex cytochrome b subunit
MKPKNRYQSTTNNNSRAGFVLQFLLIITIIFGIARLLGYTPQMLYSNFIKPHIDGFTSVKEKTAEIKSESEQRDATYQQYIDEI